VKLRKSCIEAKVILHDFFCVFSRVSRAAHKASAFGKKLGKHKTGKGCLSINKLGDFCPAT
jgi:hypothetical protein